MFAYLTPDKETFLVKEDWDTMGMRATQSNSVELKGIFAAEEQILTKVAPGPSFDPVVFGIFAYFEIFTGGNVLLVSGNVRLKSG